MQTKRMSDKSEIEMFLITHFDFNEPMLKMIWLSVEVQKNSIYGGREHFYLNLIAKLFEVILVLLAPDKGGVDPK